MRMLAGAEAPDEGERREGHQVVTQYFAQDEADRLPPSQTVYQVMEADSPVGMVPGIRNILGGFLFSGDDIYKPAGVLSGGERTRLAVARMLLRPANTLLLDEPTNHLDLDSKDVLLEALQDFGGTLVFVSHDRYFVDRLANKIVAVGQRPHRDLSGHLRPVPLEPEGPRRRPPSSRPCRSADSFGERCPSPGPTPPHAVVPQEREETLRLAVHIERLREEEAGRRRGSTPPAGEPGTRPANQRTRGPHCRARTDD